LPAWLTFDAAARRFTGTPGRGDAGSLDLRVRGSDGAFSTETAFSLLVQAAPPEATAPPLVEELPPVGDSSVGEAGGSTTGSSGVADAIDALRSSFNPDSLFMSLKGAAQSALTERAIGEVAPPDSAVRRALLAFEAGELDYTRLCDIVIEASENPLPRSVGFDDIWTRLGHRMRVGGREAISALLGLR